MESSLCEKPERHASRRLSDHLTFEGQKQKVHSLVDKVYSRECLKLASELFLRANLVRPFMKAELTGKTASGTFEGESGGKSGPPSPRTPGANR